MNLTPTEREMVIEYRRGGLLRDARAAIMRTIRSGNAMRANTLATQLGFGCERTMNRRFDEVGASYSALLDSVRYEYAQTWLLAQAELPPGGLTELSLQLGFSNPAGLYRAFKRWSGMSPREWRRANRAEAAE